MQRPEIGPLFPAGGPVPPGLVIGRTWEIEEIERRLRERVSTLLQGERRIGKTTVCGAACERSSKALRTIRPTLEKLIAEQGIPLDLSELAADPGALPVTRILTLPVEVARKLDRPVVVFLDELQRAASYSDGEQVVRDLVDIYSGHEQVTVLVDGSDQRAFEMLERDVQLDKLCSRMRLGETIPENLWREALPTRFATAGLHLADHALEAIVAFGAGRPYATMLAARHTALAARRLGGGAQVGLFEATMGLDEARRQLELGGTNG